MTPENIEERNRLMVKYLPCFYRAVGILKRGRGWWIYRQCNNDIEEMRSTFLIHYVHAIETWMEKGRDKSIKAWIIRYIHWKFGDVASHIGLIRTRLQKLAKKPNTEIIWKKNAARFIVNLNGAELSTKWFHKDFVIDSYEKRKRLSESLEQLADYIIEAGRDGVILERTCGEEDLYNSDLAKEYGITRERIRQIRKRALENAREKCLHLL